MTPQEQQMLQDLVQKITSTQLQEKDPDAENFLRQGLGHDQDALYKLAQTVLVQNIALDTARRQLQQLQQGGAQQQQPGKATSFLGSLFGHKDNPPPQPQQPSGYQQVPPSYAQSAAPAYGAQPAYGAASGGQPSFLRSAATTAAGVAAGALAFEGVESLLHRGGEGYGGFGGGFGGGDFGGGRPTEEIVNNYYDDNSGGGGGNWGGPNEQPQGGYDAGSFDGPNEQPQGGGDDQSFDSGGGFDDGSDFGGDDQSFS